MYGSAIGAVPNETIYSSTASLLKIYCEISFQILFPLIIPVSARFIASSIVDFPASLSPTTMFKPSSRVISKSL